MREARGAGHLALSFGGEAGEGVGSWYGASSVTGIGDLLSVEPLEFGPALTEIDLTITYPLRAGVFQRRGWTAPPPAPKPNLRRFHRTKAKLDIRFVSQRRTCKNAFSFTRESQSPEVFEMDFEDVVDALTYGTQTLKPSDDFNRAAFLDFVRQQRAIDRGSDADIRAQLEQASALARARWDAIDPWEKLEIDWDDMHPEARAILDDPQDWSNGHDFAPHGNDTGADIFARWSDYKTLTADQAAAEIGWGPEFDLNNELCWKDWVEINLALAFGHIKTSGICPTRIAIPALKVLRDDLQRAKTGKAWPHRCEYVSRLTRYCDILEHFT